MADEAGKQRKGKPRKGASRWRKGSTERPRSAALLALSHPLRRRILRVFLDRRPCCSPIELALEVEGPRGRIAYHINVLRRMGVVAVIDERKLRGSVEDVYETTTEDDPSIEALLEETWEEDEEEEEEE